MKISLVYIISLIFISPSAINLTGNWDVKRTSGYYSKVTNKIVSGQPNEQVTKTVWEISNNGDIDAFLNDKEIKVGHIEKINNKIILKIGKYQLDTSDIKSINANKIIFEYKTYDIEQLTDDTTSSDYAYFLRRYELVRQK